MADENNNMLGGTEGSPGAPAGGTGAGVPATPAPATVPINYFGSDGSLSEGWQASLPEDLRENGSLQSFTNVADIARSFVNTKKMVGERTVALPNENTSPEERAEFFNQLGRPETPEGYELARPAQLPEGMMYDEKRESSMLAKAHELGLTKAQMQGLADADNAYLQSAFADHGALQAAEFESAVTSLKDEWRGDFDRNLDVANRAVREFGLSEMLEAKGLADDPAMVKAMHNIGLQLLESKGPDGSPATSPDLQSQIDGIMNDLSHPFHTRNMSGHDKAVELMNRLHAQQVGIQAQ